MPGNQDQFQCRGENIKHTTVTSQKRRMHDRGRRNEAGESPERLNIFYTAVVSKDIHIHFFEIVIILVYKNSFFVFASYISIALNKKERAIP